MYVNFSEQLAIDFDLEVEYFLRNLVGWLGTNAAKDNPDKRNFHEGHYWSYNSYPEYAKLIPVFSKKQIRTVTARAIKADLLQVSNFNRKKYDNTNWYTLTAKGWAYFALEAKKIYTDWVAFPVKIDPELTTPAQMGRPPAQMGRPIPLKPNSLVSNNINIITSDVIEKPSTQINDEILDAYHEVLPECPKVKVIDSKLKSQLNQMQKNWPKYQKDGKKFSIESFKDYLNYIKQHYAWFIQPYTTSNGNVKRNNLRVFTREINITKIVNGEFNAS